MRDDLNKQMCERERFGSHMGYDDVRNLRDFTGDLGDELENLRTRESMKFRYNHSAYGTKSFNENLSPLYGLVRKNVGRPWDKFFSELCKVFNMNSVINNHILEHLFDVIETKCFMQDGQPFYQTGYYSQDGAAPVKTESGPQYYVHPATGIMCKNNKYKTYKARNRARDHEYEQKQLAVRRVVNSKLEFRRRNDKSPWFACEMAPFPADISEVRTYDNGAVYTYREFGKGEDKWYNTTLSRADRWTHDCTKAYHDRTYWKEDVAIQNPKGFYVAVCRSANNKEIRQHNLPAPK